MLFHLYTLEKTYTASKTWYFNKLQVFPFRKRQDCVYEKWDCMRTWQIQEHYFTRENKSGKHKTRCYHIIRY